MQEINTEAIIILTNRGLVKKVLQIPDGGTFPNWVTDFSYESDNIYSLSTNKLQIFEDANIQNKTIFFLDDLETNRPKLIEIIRNSEIKFHLLSHENSGINIDIREYSNLNLEVGKHEVSQNGIHYPLVFEILNDDTISDKFTAIQNGVL